MPASNKRLLQLLLVDTAKFVRNFIQHEPEIEIFAKWLDYMGYKVTEIDAYDMMSRFTKMPYDEFNAEYVDEDGNINEDYMLIKHYRISAGVNAGEFTLFFHTG